MMIRMIVILTFALFGGSVAQACDEHTKGAAATQETPSFTATAGTIGIDAVVTQAKSPTQTNAATREAHFTIAGMSCLDCAEKVKTAVKEVCATFTVDHRSGHATCVYEPARTSPEKIAGAINQTSFKATLVNN